MRHASGIWRRERNSNPRMYTSLSVKDLGPGRSSRYLLCYPKGGVTAGELKGASRRSVAMVSRGVLVLILVTVTTAFSTR
jgi:hypothetical protein